MAERIEISKLRSFYESNANIENLHELIRKETYRTTGRLIGRQSDRELRIIMKLVYDGYAEHRPNQLLDQINSLNQQTLRFCMKSILNNISDREHYVNNLDENLHMRPKQLMSIPQATDRHSNRSTRLQDRGMSMFNQFSN